jgi:deleted-in-malignant-brain-tumors protein 1
LFAETNGQVRLVSGTNALEGRLEIYNAAAWGTVCDDNFDLLDAAVACRLLGFRCESTSSLLYDH